MRERDTMDDLILRIEKGEKFRYQVELRQGGREPIRGAWNNERQDVLVGATLSLRNRASSEVDLGQELAKSLPKEVCDALVQQSASKTQRRLLLDVHPDLPELVWELLPGKRDLFLPPNGWSLVRYVGREGTTGSPRAEIKTRLRVLLLLGEQPVDGEAVVCVRAITESLAGLGKDRVEVTVAGSPVAVETLRGSPGPYGITALETSKQLDELFKNGDGHHLMHYFGHSDAAWDKARGLELGGALGWLGQERLAQLLKDGPTRVVILSACRIGDAFARQLLHSVDHVIGTTCLVPADRAARWSGEMHRLLAEYKSIDEAVTLSRGKLLRTDQGPNDGHKHLAWAVSHWTRTRDREAFTSPEEVLIGAYKERLRTRLGKVLDVTNAPLFSQHKHTRYSELRVGQRKESAPERDQRSEKKDRPRTTSALAAIMSSSARESEPIPPTRLRNPNSRVLIEAGPGAGKTTLLQALAWAELGREGGLLPILVHLPSLARENLSVSQYAARDEDADNQDLPVVLESRMRDGKCLLLLDGFDEVEKNYRPQLLENLALRSLGSCPVIATSRPGFDRYIASPLRLASVELLPLEKRQSRRLLASFVNDPMLLEELACKLETSFLPLDLGSSPFFLSLVGWLYGDWFKGKRIKPMPERLVNVYEHAIEAICCGEMRRRTVEAPREWTQKVSWVHWQKLLEDLSWHLLQRDQRGDVSEASLVQFLPEAVRREKLTSTFDSLPPLEVLEELSAMRVLSKCGNSWTFVHSSVQEYLAARWLARTGNESIADDVVNRGAWLGDWEMVIALYAGVLEAHQAERLDCFVNVLLNTPLGPKGEHDDWFERRAWLAAIGLGFAKNGSLDDDKWAALADQVTRRYYGRHLSDISMDWVLETFLGSLSRPTPPQPLLSAPLFIFLKGQLAKRSNMPMLEIVSIFTAANVLKTSCEAFQEFSDIFARVIYGRGTDVIYGEALRAMAWYPGERSTLLKLIGDKALPIPQRIVIANELLDYLDDAQADYVAGCLVEMLPFDDYAQAPDLFRRLGRFDLLIEVLKNPESDFYQRVASAWGLRREPSATNHLLSILNDVGENGSLRSMAADALADNPDARLDLEAILQRTSEECGLRMAAARALKDVPESCPALTAILEDVNDNSELRCGIAACCPEESILIRVAADANDELLISCLHGLAGKAPKYLLMVLMDKENSLEVRAAAAGSLSGNKCAYSALVEVIAAELVSIEQDAKVNPWDNFDGSMAQRNVQHFRQMLIERAVQSLVKIPNVGLAAIAQVLQSDNNYLMGKAFVYTREGVRLVAEAIVSGKTDLVLHVPFASSELVLWPKLDGFTLLSDDSLVGDLVRMPLGEKKGR